jgi:formate hydrogenlyase subunit 6/NADH:ubiquinone oxidoreductase subunit I
MIEIINKSKCSGCKACYNVCPINCINMIIDEEVFGIQKSMKMNVFNVVYVKKYVQN